MKKIARVAVVLAISSGAIVAGSIAGYGIAIATAPVGPAAQIDEGGVQSVEQFPVNDSGQTYGLIDQGLLSDGSMRPQLVLVTTDTGEEGYAYYLELFPTVAAKTPADAERLSTDAPYQVPVYEVDGRTFIGLHTVNRLPEK